MMAAIQYHRGPDGFGVETSMKKGVGFSHARLSIIDLVGNRARQPIRQPRQTACSWPTMASFTTIKPHPHPS